MELRGRTIVITRAASQSEGLREGLTNLGARVIECPAIEIVPVDDWTGVDRVIASLSDYNWLVFTSANAVDCFMERVEALGANCTVPIAAVGPATAERLRQDWKRAPALIPSNFRAEGLLEALPQDLRGQRILIPRAEAAREIVPEELRRRGAEVDIVTVYRTVRSEDGLAKLRNVLASERVDCIVFTSPSAVRFAAEALNHPLDPSLSRTPIAVIGPVAREAVISLGLKIAIEAESATVAALIDAIRESCN